MTASTTPVPEISAETVTIVDRPFSTEADYWRVHEFLRATYPITPPGWNWEIRRWEGWRFHREDNSITPAWGERLHLWETSDGQLVGLAHPEGEGDVFLEMHPDYRWLEAEMLTWAESHLTILDETSGRKRLDLFVYEYDSPRLRLAEQRGYEKMPWGMRVRHQRIGQRALPVPQVAEGYLMRGTRADEREYQKIADLLNAAFNRTIHTGREFGVFAETSPSFRHDLNLIMEAPDGTFAALVGLTYDEPNRRAIVEPVCTHPDHRRKGLSQALLYEGLHRVRALGAMDVWVDTGDTSMANGFYESVGFTEAYQGYIWRKWC